MKPKFAKLTVFFDIGDTLVADKKWNAGAKVCLTKLRQEKISLGVISNTGKLTREELISLLPNDFDFSLFDTQLVVLSSEVGFEKPDPAIFHHAIGKAGSNPDTCYFVGERQIEIEAAKRHGMRAFHVGAFPDDFDRLSRLITEHRYHGGFEPATTVVRKLGDKEPPDKMTDSMDLDRLQKLVTLDTASEATKQILGWGKWVVGGFVAVMFLLGITTYADFKVRIEKAAEDAAAKVATDASDKVKNEIETALTEARTEVEEAKGKLLAQLQKQFELASDSLNQKRAHAEKSIIAIGVVAPTDDPGVMIRIFDSENLSILPGKPVRSTGEPDTGKTDVDQLYEYLTVSHKFFHAVFNRDSYDNMGGEIIASLNYRRAFNNTFWNGKQLVVGNGDGEIFKTFIELDIIASEYSNAVIQHTVNFVYESESGAIHKHYSDVFASLVKQWHLGQTVDQADWLLGTKIFGSNIKGVALRSLKDPGAAYDDPLLGKDNQPKHISGFLNKRVGNGDIHANSGILNYAFYLAATKIGGNSWEDPGRIWYQTLQSLKPNTKFLEFAKATLAAADGLFGNDSHQYKSVKAAWEAVGIGSI